MTTIDRAALRRDMQYGIEPNTGNVLALLDALDAAEARETALREVIASVRDRLESWTHGEDCE